MSETVPWLLDYTGFVDYRHALGETPELWGVIVGTIFYIVSFISFIPEVQELIDQRTNWGLSLYFAFGNSIGQWLLVVNFLCLNYLEFLALPNYSFAKWYPPLLVFIELFTQWILFLPCIYLTMILDDREHNMHDRRAKLWSKIQCIGLVILNLGMSFGLLLLWWYLGSKYGFDSDIVHKIGDTCGIASAICEVIQFAPQYYTTIKIRDNGSLSLLMLEIQAPTALMNGLYMAVITHESWTTYITSLIDASAQFGLLVLCFGFKWCNSRKKDSTDFSAVSAHVMKPIIPASLL